MKHLFFKKILFTFSLGVFISYSNSFAWGPAGHHIVGQIVKSELPASIRDSVQKYLGTMSFEDASTWMDDMRSDPSYDYMKTWHYVNIEKGQTYNPKAGERNVVTELERVIKELNSKSKLSKDQINTDIKVLFHLGEDLGMPLHCGYPEDKGGNTIKVNFMGKTVNLHHVWDTDIIVYKNITSDQCINDCSKLSKSELNKLSKIDVLGWVKDSQSFLPEVYSFQNNTIDDTYINKNVPVIEKQLYISGLRLAKVLIQIFSK